MVPTQESYQGNFAKMNKCSMKMFERSPDRYRYLFGTWIEAIQRSPVEVVVFIDVHLVGRSSFRVRLLWTYSLIIRQRMSRCIWKTQQQVVVCVEMFISGVRDGWPWYTLQGIFTILRPLIGVV